MKTRKVCDWGIIRSFDLPKMQIILPLLLSDFTSYGCSVRRGWLLITFTMPTERMKSPLPRLFEHKNWRIHSKENQEHKKILGLVLNQYLLQGKRVSLSQSTMNERFTLSTTPRKEKKKITTLITLSFSLTFLFEQDEKWNTRVFKTPQSSIHI